MRKQPMSVPPTARTISGERSYQKLLENIGDSVSVVDMAGRALWTTAAVRSDLGYDGNFWEGADLLSLVHPDDATLIQGLLAKLLAQPTSTVSGETRLRRPDGGYSHVGFTAVNRLDDPDIGGIVIASRSVDSDVEWRKSQESYQQDLQDAAAGQSRFIAGIGHEIRTPLHVISGLSELLASDIGLSAEAKRHIETIGRESVALRRIIDDLLDFSKISAGHMELGHEPFSPAAVGDAAVASLRTLAEEKGLTLRAAVDPAVPRLVLGDEFRVRQILVNLLSNAVKYTETGSVQLEVSNQPTGHVQFSVTDTGTGIPKDALETLFEPYKQARLADEQKGTGLGLAICSKLVALMGSELEVQTGSEGSRFWCDIEFEHARRSTDGPATSTQTTGSGQILVVDDSEVNRMLASAQLERLGYSPVAVASGREALDYLTGHSVSAVLMDWHMPEMDGLEATRTLRRSSEIDPSLPVIAMTASAMSGDRETCLAAGMNDYLAKPVSIDDLAASLSKWVEDSPLDNGESSSPEASSNETIEQLVEELGDRELVASVVKTFLDELPRWKQELVGAASEGDAVVARRSAHTMKSTAAMLGASDLASSCAAFESTVAENPAAAFAKIDDLIQQLDGADSDLRRAYRSLTDTPL